MPLRRCWCLYWGSGAVCVIGGLCVRSSGGGWRRRGRPNTANTVVRLRCGAGGSRIRCRIVPAGFWNPTRRRPARGLWPGGLPILLFVIVRGLGRPICRTFRRFQWPCWRILGRRGNARKWSSLSQCVRAFRRTTNLRFGSFCIRLVCAMSATCGRSDSGRRSCGPVPCLLGFVECGVVVAG